MCLISTRTLRSHSLRRLKTCTIMLMRDLDLNLLLLLMMSLKSLSRMPTRLVSEIIYDRDFEYDYFGFKTLERSYLLKVHGKVVERPQHMLMRVSVGIHKEDIDSAIQTYQLMSQRWFTHASPTLFNPGTPTVQLSSCFLICMKDDSGLRFMISSKMGLAKTCMINSLLMEKTRINEH
ncbi:hypothetical protein Bca101_016372 [Brassica carinata]